MMATGLTAIAGLSVYLLRPNFSNLSGRVASWSKRDEAFMRHSFWGRTSRSVSLIGYRVGGPLRERSPAAAYRLAWCNVPVTRTGTANAHHIQVRRADVERVWADTQCGPRTFRIVPTQQANEKPGIRLQGLEKVGLWASLGFENGDELISVNSINMGDPSQVLAAYTKLKNTRSLDVRLRRSGQFVSLTIDLLP